MIINTCLGCLQTNNPIYLILTHYANSFLRPLACEIDHSSAKENENISALVNVSRDKIIPEEVNWMFGSLQSVAFQPLLLFLCLSMYKRFFASLALIAVHSPLSVKPCKQKLACCPMTFNSERGRDSFGILHTQHVFYYRSSTKLRKGNVFSRVCHSVKGEGPMPPTGPCDPLDPTRKPPDVSTVGGIPCGYYPWCIGPHCTGIPLA